MPDSPRPVLLYVVNATWFFVSHRLELARRARDHGFDVHVAAAPDDTVAQVTAAGIQFHPVPFLRGEGGSDVAAIRALWSLYRSLRPRIVHHVTLKPVLYGSLVARATGVPRIVNAVTGLGTLYLAEGTAAALRRGLVLEALRAGCNRHGVTMLFQNQSDADAYRAAGITGTQAIVPGSGVDLDAFKPTPVPGGTPLVVLPARMLRDKGVVEFVEAARALRLEGVVARWALVGGLDRGNESALSRETIEAWVAAGDVEWWGHRTDIFEVLRQASVVCLPSYREGLPRALIEAAAAGRCIVTTNVPGCRDVVRDGVEGILVPARDSSALASALARVLADPPLRDAMAAAARARAEREFGLDDIIAKTLALYPDPRGEAA